jgi:hypothetical protein
MRREQQRQFRRKAVNCFPTESPLLKVNDGEREAPAAGLFISDENGHALAGAALRGPALRWPTRRAAPCQCGGWREAKGGRAGPAAHLAAGPVARDRSDMGRRPIPRRQAARRAKSRPKPTSKSTTRASEGRASARTMLAPVTQVRGRITRSGKRLRSRRDVCARGHRRSRERHRSRTHHFQRASEGKDDDDGNQDATFGAGEDLPTE